MNTDIGIELGMDTGVCANQQENWICLSSLFGPCEKFELFIPLVLGEQSHNFEVLGLVWYLVCIYAR